MGFGNHLASGALQRGGNLRPWTRGRTIAAADSPADAPSLSRMMRENASTTLNRAARRRPARLTSPVTSDASVGHISPARLCGASGSIISTYPPPSFQRIIMNAQDDPNSWAVQKFGIGQPVPRTEDPTLVQGRGRYADDVSVAGQAYASIVRSSHAHGVLKGIDTAVALAMPGVLAVYTGADLRGYGSLKCVPPLKNRDGSPR